MNQKKTPKEYRKLAIQQAKEKRDLAKQGGTRKTKVVKSRKAGNTSDNDENVVVTSLGNPKMLKDRPNISILNVKPFMIEQGILVKIAISDKESITIDSGDGWDYLIVTLMSYLHNEHPIDFLKILGEYRVLNETIKVYKVSPVYSMDKVEAGYNVPNSNYILISSIDGRDKIESIINLLNACDIELENVRISIIKK